MENICIILLCVYRTADISVLSRSLDSVEIYISCSVHKYECYSILYLPLLEEEYAKREVDLNESESEEEEYKPRDSHLQTKPEKQNGEDVEELGEIKDDILPAPSSQVTFDISEPQHSTSKTDEFSGKTSKKSMDISVSRYIYNMKIKSNNIFLYIIWSNLIVEFMLDCFQFNTLSSKKYFFSQYWLLLIIFSSSFLDLDLKDPELEQAAIKIAAAFKG